MTGILCAVKLIGMTGRYVTKIVCINNKGDLFASTKIVLDLIHWESFSPLFNKKKS